MWAIAQSVGLVAAGVLTFVGSARAAGSQLAPFTESVSSQRALLDRYCVTCHNERLRTANLALDTLELTDIPANAEVWEKVVRKLRAGAMPPRPRPRPDQRTYDGFRTWLETRLDRAAEADLNPGRTEAFHRLSRTEYKNVIRDLLALDVDVSDLLTADDTSYGFDNIAGVLGVSPTLMDRYLSAARKVARLTVGSPVSSPTAETFRIASDLGQGRPYRRAPVRDTWWQRSCATTFRRMPSYVIEVEPDGAFYIEPHKLEVTLEGERVVLFDVGRALQPGERGPSLGYVREEEPLRVPASSEGRPESGWRGVPEENVGGAWRDQDALPASIHRRGVGW